jgi:stress-induced morphogen
MVLKVEDESTMHTEHEAMRESGYTETHFRILVVSDAFKQKV